MNDNISKDYEAKHLANILKAQKRIKKLYESTIDETFKESGSITLKGDKFKLSDYPIIEKAINAIMHEFQTTLRAELINGIDDSWELSGSKIIDLVSATYKGAKLPDSVMRTLYDKHANALRQFSERKVKGLNLSDRVWKYTNQFRSEIEQGLYTGVSQGMSAVRMAQQQKQYLQEPDKLFRRVRDANGKLQLSQAAKRYKPGRGVYRSSFKNALRISRNENNFAYRTADSVRWKSMPFILGFNVKLSNNHPRYDVCDKLAGKYPKDFVFKGWHVSCLCYSTPILPDEDEFEAYNQAVQDGTDDEFAFTGSVSNMPAGYNSWMSDNTAKINSGQIKPLWAPDNYEGGKGSRKLKFETSDEPIDEISKRIEYIKANAAGLYNAEEQAAVAKNSKAVKSLRGQLTDLRPQLEEAKMNQDADKYSSVAEQYNQVVKLINSLLLENQLYEDQYAIRAAQLLKAPKPGSMKVTGTRDENILRGNQLFNMIVGNNRAVEGSRLPASIKAGRAAYSMNNSIMKVAPGESLKTVAHEMAHWLEHKDGEYFKKVKAFYAKRTQGEAVKRLKDLFPDRKYDVKEIIKEDKFIEPYTGKVYSIQKTNFEQFDANKQYATEITSMWFTHALSDLGTFIKRDPEHFEFIYRLLQE